MTDSANNLPILINPDDPSRRRPFREMAGLLLLLTPDEFATVENLAVRLRMSVDEVGLRALAYGLTVLQAAQRQMKHDRPRMNGAAQ